MRIRQFPALPHPQNAADWVTQYWNIALGRPVDDVRDAWLLGPIGRPGENAETFMDRLATERGLRILRNKSGSGLLDDVHPFGPGVSAGIKAFYTRTSDFAVSARTRWSPLFSALGGLVSGIFSRRVQQLCLPRGREESPVQIRSEVITLAHDDGRPVHRVWYRRDRSTGAVIFYGIYASCRMPSGEYGLKVVLPLPHGSATVVFRVSGNSGQDLTLVSSGKTCGDPGFYFLVEDRNGRLWKHYLPSFRERITFSEDATGQLRAHHAMSLWHLPVYHMDYTLTEGPKGASD